MLKCDNLLLKHKTHFGHNILSSYLVINVIMWYWSTFYFWQQLASENNSDETIWTLLQSWYWISETSNESVNRPHHNCLGFRDEYKENKQISLCVHCFPLRSCHFMKRRPRRKYFSEKCIFHPYFAYRGTGFKVGQLVRPEKHRPATAQRRIKFTTQ